MYYVYHGFVGPDHHDASEGPCYQLTECETEEDVLDLKADHACNVDRDSSNAIFRVIEGKERKLEPKTEVTEWRLT